MIMGNNVKHKIYKPVKTVESLSPLSYTRVPLIILPNDIFFKSPIPSHNYIAITNKASAK